LIIGRETRFYNYIEIRSFNFNNEIKEQQNKKPKELGYFVVKLTSKGKPRVDFMLSKIFSIVLIVKCKYFIELFANDLVLL
jgi:hypothetical protein